MAPYRTDALLRLAPEARDLALACCRAVLEVWHIGFREFDSRIGITRDQMRELLARWPNLKSEQEVLGVWCAMNEIAHGVRFADREWERFFSVPRERVSNVFQEFRIAAIGLIAEAVRELRNGELVAFPTETVYGLGADATNASAIWRIFEVKGRPSTNPLIVHVADENVARRYARQWPLAASRLTARFWPGPLTLVVPKHESIVAEVTAGLDTVGLRAPDHPLTLELLRAFDGPLAGPSANKSSHVSPTTARHVREEFAPGEIDVILDGGPCTVGIESTVLDLSGEPPRMLRPGAVTREQIEEVIGQPVESKPVLSEVSTAALSPGTHERHYAPRTPAFRVEPADVPKLDLTDAALLDQALDPESYARQFYARLRMLDEQRLRAIYIVLPPDTPAWAAVRDRILRATSSLEGR